MNLWNFITLCWLNIKSGHAKNVFYFIDWKLNDLYQWLNNDAVKQYIKQVVAQSYIQLKGFHLPYDFGKLGEIKGIPEYGWYTKPAEVLRNTLDIEFQEQVARNKGNKYWLTLLRIAKGGWYRLLTFAAGTIFGMLFEVYTAFEAGYFSAKLVDKGIVSVCYDKWVKAEMDKIKAYRRARRISLDEPLTAEDFKYASSMTLGEFAGWCIQEYFNENGQGYMDAQVLKEESTIVKRALSYKISKVEFFNFYRKAGLQCIYHRGDSGNRSDCITSMWYDFQNSTLYVYFGREKDPNKTYYGYYHVAWDDMVKFTEQKTDSSIGVWFNRYIRGVDGRNYIHNRFNSMSAVIFDFAEQHKDDNKIMPLIAVPPLEIPREVEPPEPPPEPEPAPPEPEPEPSPDPPDPDPEEEYYYWKVEAVFRCDGYFSDTIDRVSSTYPFKYTANVERGVGSANEARALIQDRLKAAYDYKQYWLDLMSAENVVKWFSVTAEIFSNSSSGFKYYSNAVESAEHWAENFRNAINAVSLVGDEVSEEGIVVSVDYTVYKR